MERHPKDTKILGDFKSLGGKEQCDLTSVWLKQDREGASGTHGCTEKVHQATAVHALGLLAYGVKSYRIMYPTHTSNQ